MEGVKAAQEDCRDFVRLCREKIRRTKAKLELNLATGFKENKKIFYKDIDSKIRAEESLHPLMDAECSLA